MQARQVPNTADPNVLVKKEVSKADYEPISDRQNVKRFVTDYFADAPLLAKIAGCESHYRQYDSNGNVVHGEVNHYDVGVMQINVLYHQEEADKLGYDLNTIEGNVAYARHLYDREGAKPWSSSSGCWSNGGYNLEIALNK